MNPHEPKASKCPASLRAMVAAVACSLRGLPLLFCAAPQTPLRVLCIVALDTLHVLRTSRRLSRQRIGELATFVDFQACANAVLDRKHACEAELQAIQSRLDEVGLRPRAEQYLVQLRMLEGRRPTVGGDDQRFDEVRAYREAVARLSLATIAAVAFREESAEIEPRVNRFDGDLETLLGIVMQCQIIDDVLDYRVDARAGLPGFLTAMSSMPHSLELTARAARDYASLHHWSPDAGAFPFRVALLAVTAITRLVVRVGHWRCGTAGARLVSGELNPEEAVVPTKGV